MADTRRMWSMRERVAEWAARHDQDALVGGIDDWLGDHPREEEQVLSGLGFALLAPPDDGPSLLERYVATRPQHPRAERMVLKLWEEARFALLEIERVRLDEGLEVVDALTEERLFVRERSATRQLAAGDWLAGFLVDVDGEWELEGTVTRVPPHVRIDMVQAGLASLRGGAAASGPKSKRLARPVIRAMHEGLRPPCIVNGDGHSVVMLTCTLDLSWKRLVEVASGWEDAEVDGDELSVVAPEIVQEIGGRPVVAAFQGDEDGVTLTVNSEERLEAMRGRWREATGEELPVLEQDVQRIRSNPAGRRLVTDLTRTSRDAASPEEALAAWHDEQEAIWADQPIPALDGLTPREALAEGRRAEVRALLPDGAAALRRDLGF